MNKCFVIQPFDNNKYDKRFVDIFKPAIENFGLEAYRIDKDLSVRIPIDEIERNITESQICFAEITTDNPNVWYELGFASEFINRYTTRGFGAINKNREL